MEFLSVINSIGIIPLLILILVIFILLFREVKKDNQSTKDSLDCHKKEIEKNLREYKVLVDRQIEEENAAISRMDERIRTIETDYAKKTDLQEAISGWRMEIRHLGDKIDKVLMR